MVDFLHVHGKKEVITLGDKQEIVIRKVIARVIELINSLPLKLFYATNTA